MSANLKAAMVILLGDQVRNDLEKAIAAPDMQASMPYLQGALARLSFLLDQAHEAQKEHDANQT